VQIRQIIALLCEQFGESLPVPAGHAPIRAFPSAARLASATEAELRACKMGFRAPHLLAAASRVAEGKPDLESLRSLTASEARAQLRGLRGVGEKIADCVLLFAYGFQECFPVDVWVMKALRQLYFPRRRPSRQQLREFPKTHFGPYAGYAQQYLFCYMRSKSGRGLEFAQSDARQSRGDGGRDEAGHRTSNLGPQVLNSLHANHP
jgi:N-glycosylase/DNA lyase